MCIIFLHANANPAPGGYKLILASNRDEFYARPAASADRWSDASHVFGGIDMEPGREGGTWLAISGKDGVIKAGALLNITGDFKANNAYGRGPIVSNYVKSNQSNKDYCNELMNSISNYNGFNFVTVEIRDNSAVIANCSNVPIIYEEWSNDPLNSHSFGNSPTKTPFKKVKMGRESFQKIIDENLNNKIKLIDKCVTLLKNRTKYWPDDELYKRAPNWAEDLSSIYVEIPKYGYGSRTSTVILIDSENRMDFYEETMSTINPSGEWKKTHIVEQF